MNNLVDITNFEYDFSKNEQERAKHFIEYVKDPYNFLCCGYKVTVEFTGINDFETSLAHGLENSQ